MATLSDADIVVNSTRVMALVILLMVAKKKAFVHSRYLASCAIFKKMAESTVSTTDFACFKRLANQNLVDVDIEIGDARAFLKSGASKSFEEAIDKSDAKSDVAKEEEEKTNFFAKAMSKESDKREDKKTPEVVTEPPAAPPKKAESDSDDESPPQPSFGSSTEKQGYLIELQALQNKGVRLTRKFTMKDTIEDLQFEYEKQNTNLTTANYVAFMKDTLKVAFTGIELGNNKLGPFLQLNGWAETATRDMDRYDHALERVYKKYWRKQQMSPLVELAWLIVGSMFMHHFKTKFFGPSGGTKPVVPPMKRGTTARPTMRPPSF